MEVRKREKNSTGKKNFLFERKEFNENTRFFQYIEERRELLQKNFTGPAEYGENRQNI